MEEEKWPPCDECGCFNCMDDCSVCWGGPMCDWDDESPCRQTERAKQEGYC